LNQDDKVNHPSHYTQGGIECIDAIAAATKGLSGIEAVCTGNIIKYVWRWKRKNGIEDLQKARKYLDMLIERNREGISDEHTRRIPQSEEIPDKSIG
jgi:hypothetical protein